LRAPSSREAQDPQVAAEPPQKKQSTRGRSSVRAAHKTILR